MTILTPNLQVTPCKLLCYFLTPESTPAVATARDVVELLVTLKYYLF